MKVRPILVHIQILHPKLLFSLSGNSDDDDSSDSDSDEEDNEQYIDEPSDNPTLSSEQNQATQGVTVAEINAPPPSGDTPVGSQLLSPSGTNDTEMAIDMELTPTVSTANERARRAGAAPMDTAGTEEGAVGGTTTQANTVPEFVDVNNAPTPADALPVPETPPEVSSPPQQDIDPAIRSILGDLEVPEGIDASFLAALPPEMREEVIAEHMRQQRIRQRATQPPPVVASEAAAPVAEVNPEFLAALPLNIQEEVLAQQRLEQQRQAAVNMNPNDPVDAAAFFQNLTPSLRQAVS